MRGNKINIGRIYSDKEKKRLSDAHKGHAPSYVAFGKDNHQWKGGKVKYSGLHAWVEKELGKPKKCERCGVVKNKSRTIDWANKSGKYLRNIKDWLRYFNTIFSNESI